MDYSPIIGVTALILLIHQGQSDITGFFSKSDLKVEPENKRGLFSWGCEPNNTTGSIVFGDPSGDGSVVMRYHAKKCAIPAMVQEEEIIFPPVGEIKPPLFRQISRVEFIDQLPPGQGGCVEITGGGIGMSTFSSAIRSQRGLGYDYEVVIKAY